MPASRSPHSGARPSISPTTPATRIPCMPACRCSAGRNGLPPSGCGSGRSCAEVAMCCVAAALAVSLSALFIPSARSLPMGLDLVSAGRNVPDEINVIIEIPKDAEPVKYEVDKASGAIFVDRVLSTPMRYPCNYGYVPNTLCGDGDPADVLVVLPLPLVPGSVIRCRPVGVLKMTDEAGSDEK